MRYKGNPLQFETYNSNSLAPQDTERWTSEAYQVRFGRIDTVEPADEEPVGFRVSAWGLSKRLHSLLDDYSDRDIHDATEWLTAQQNNIVADILHQMSFNSQHEQASMPSLDQLFITVDAELYLPRGLRMIVSCVTNIVPHGTAHDGLDKFVAILDPTEVETYIFERKGSSTSQPNERLH